MTSKWFKIAGASILVAGMTFVYADTQSQTRSATRQEWAQKRFDRMASHLNLTEAQKTQARGFLQEARSSAKELGPQLKQNHQALAAAVKANNTADIERLSAEQGRLMGKMMAIHSEAFAKIYQTLTPDQRAKADQMHEHFRGMMHQRKQG
jgi:Spy/CpxP family protein refolding chaperone